MVSPQDVGTKEENKAYYSLEQVLFKINVTSPAFNNKRPEPQTMEKQVKKDAPNMFEAMLQESIIALSDK